MYGDSSAGSHWKLANPVLTGATDVTETLTIWLQVSGVGTCDTSWNGRGTGSVDFATVPPVRRKSISIAPGSGSGTSSVYRYSSKIGRSGSRIWNSSSTSGSLSPATSAISWSCADSFTDGPI